jgi:Ca2+-binding RTX toxin-like protein
VILGGNGSAIVPNGGLSIFSAMIVTSTNPGVGGTETIRSGSGNEVLIAGPGTATITGGNGAELIFGGDAKVTLSGTTIRSYASTDIGPTGGGNDTVTTGNGNATIYGGPGDAIIHGGPGTDINENQRQACRQADQATTVKAISRPHSRPTRHVATRNTRERARDDEHRVAARYRRLDNLPAEADKFRSVRDRKDKDRIACVPVAALSPYFRRDVAGRVRLRGIDGWPGQANGREPSS